MDLARWDQGRYDQIVEDTTKFLATIGYKDPKFIPISAVNGDNVSTQGTIEWYKGPSLLELIQKFTSLPRNVEKPLRIAITNTESQSLGELKGEIISGIVQGGILTQNDKIIIQPEGTTATVGKI